ncbi:DUF5658 family protein [Halorientalis brevis]|uniref:DUF5658 family protein n=1 Tax=Halorientalis brevis TaxID=1126241 RepID=A0ABD6C767_9EURY|nr:DUF5658 family protein [Halorientalis brevis]
MPSDALETDRPSNRQPTTSSTRFGSAWSRIARHERSLWGLVAAVFCADLLSTYHGVHHGLTEGNPIVRSVLADGGFVAFTTLKLATVCFAFSAWVVTPRPNRIVVPLGLALPWAATSLINVVAILA